MAASCTVSFAGLKCRFENFGSSTFCDSWQWKLDPYLIPDESPPYVSYALTILNRPAENVHTAGEQLSCVQDGFFLRQVFRREDDGTLWRYVRRKNGENLLSFSVSPAWDEIALLSDCTKSSGQMAFEYLTHLFPACALSGGVLTFHGALVEHRGCGFILSAASGTGKTTHARLWRDCRQALILNGDRASCRKTEGRWTGYGLPWSGTSGEQINRSVQIRAFVQLERGEENEVCRVGAEEALISLLAGVQCPAWDAGRTERMLDLLSGFAGEIPVLRLRCRPDEEAVEVLERALEEI